ncbi:MAG: tRNA pseudouridine(38-40) synthase TruA [Bacteroidia bacterium]
MPRYFIHLAYKGTGFHGWQIQPNAPSVQEALNKALSVLLKSETETTGCGRTDTGVHASSFVAHFDSREQITDPEKFTFQLNALLPPSIRIFKTFEVEAEAHSRFDATQRSYSYYIARQPNPFLTEFTWFHTRPIDLGLINKAASMCIGNHDFSCFSKSGGQQMTNICNVSSCHWTQTEAILQLDVAANRFLRNMVRAMVGTMLDVGTGKMSLSEFQAILKHGTRSDAGQSVPPQGLFLEQVVYPYFQPQRQYFFNK